MTFLGSFKTGFSYPKNTHFRWHRTKSFVIILLCCSVYFGYQLKSVTNVERHVEDFRFDLDVIRSAIKNETSTGIYLTVPIQSETSAVLVGRRKSDRRICPSQLSYMYLKTHKTGSTTLYAILGRLKNQASGLNRVTNYPSPYAGGYPGSFRKNLSFQEGKNGIRADILSSHIRFNEAEVRAIMNPNAKYITILRSPKSQFESSFYFYYGNHPNGRQPNNKVTCPWLPYAYVTGRNSVSYSEYLKIADTQLNESIPWFFRSRNYQAYDLGLDPANLTKQYTLQQAQILDNIFDLVLILDYLFESLILLKDMLCMEWDQIIPDPPNPPQYTKHEYSTEDRRILQKLTFQDRLLYEYFNDSLWRKVDEYGAENMKRDVTKLKSLIQTRAPETKNHTSETSNTTEATIKRRQKTAKQYIYELVSNILSREKGSVSDLPVATRIAKYMVENNGWCPEQIIQPLAQP